MPNPNYPHPTHPAEFPLPGSFAELIEGANDRTSEHYAKHLAEDPRLKLDLDSSMDFFDLTPEQKEELDDRGKKALTALVWHIEDLIDENPVPTAEERQLALERGQELAAEDPEKLIRIFGSDDPLAVVKEYDEMLRTDPPAERDAYFKEEVKQLIDLADLVLKGNRIVIRALAGNGFDRGEYGDMLRSEVNDLKDEPDPKVAAVQAMNEEHGWDKKPAHYSRRH